MSEPRSQMAQWLSAYTEDRKHSPWPNDPDGGELRIGSALQAVLELHQPTQSLRSFTDTRQCCKECDDGRSTPVWPCKTVAAVAQVLDVEVPA